MICNIIQVLLTVTCGLLLTVTVSMHVNPNWYGIVLPRSVCPFPFSIPLLTVKCKLHGPLPFTTRIPGDMTSSTPLRIGFLGAAWIAEINGYAILESQSNCQVAAIASRSQEKANVSLSE